MRDQSQETRLLDQHPGVRERIAAIVAFQDWRAGLPQVDIDGERLYVLGGDQLKDDDQIVVAWIHQFTPHLLKGNPQYGHQVK